MPITTYAELRAEVAAQAVRPDLADGGANAARMPVFIQLAERRIDRMLNKLGGGELVETAALTTTAEVIDLPPDFNGMRMLALALSNFISPLLYRPPEKLYDEFQSQAAGKPTAYTLHGKGDLTTNLTRARFRPIPDGVYNLVAYYYKKITALANGSDSGTNWMLLNNPDAYLYACLLECAVWRKDADGITNYTSLLQKAVEDIAELDDAARVGNASPRTSRSVRMIRGM